MMYSPEQKFGNRSPMSCFLSEEMNQYLSVKSFKKKNGREDICSMCAIEWLITTAGLYRNTI
jgi:hypothetical protein